MILKSLCSSSFAAWQSSIFKRSGLRQAVVASSTARCSFADVRFSSTLLESPSEGNTKGTSASSLLLSGNVSTVFGATGFLGRYVVQQLAKMGSGVIVPYRGSEAEVTHLKHMGKLGQVVPVRLDIRDEESIRAAMAGCNVVVNLIGRDYESHSFPFEEINVWITERVSRLADEHGNISRYIHVSALGACRDHRAAQYKTKAEGEEMIRQNFPEATIFRPAHMFGTEDRLLNTWAQFARKMPVVPIIGDGSNRFQPVHVTDVAAAIVGAVADDGSSIGKTYELGGPDVYTVNELVALVFKVIKEEPRIIHMPFDLSRQISKFIGDDLLKSIPFPTRKLITFSRNNIRALKKHYVVSPGVRTFKDLDIRPRKLEGDDVLEYLHKYRKSGESIVDATVSAQKSAAGSKAS